MSYGRQMQFDYPTTVYTFECQYNLFLDQMYTLPCDMIFSNTRSSFEYYKPILNK